MTRKTILNMFSLSFFNFGTRRGKFIFSDPVIKTDDKWEIKKRQLDYRLGHFLLNRLTSKLRAPHHQCMQQCAGLLQEFRFPTEWFISEVYTTKSFSPLTLLFSLLCYLIIHIKQVLGVYFSLLSLSLSVLDREIFHPYLIGDDQYRKYSRRCLITKCVTYCI